VDGNNSFTAIAQDSYGRRDTNSITVNLPATNSYSYDLNGNLLSDGNRNFAYDDENQLTSVWVTNVWRSDFVYDGSCDGGLSGITNGMPELPAGCRPMKCITFTMATW